MGNKSKHILYTSIAFSCLTTNLFSVPLTPYTVSLGTDSATETGGLGTGTSGDFRYVLNQIANNQALGTTGIWHVDFDPSVTTVTASKTMDNYTNYPRRRPSSFVGELTCRNRTDTLREL